MTWSDREVEEARQEWEKVKDHPHTGFCGVADVETGLVGCDVCTAGDGDPRCQGCGMSVGMPGCLCAEGPQYGPCVTVYEQLAVAADEPPGKERRSFSYRFPTELGERLQTEAEARGVPMNWLVEKLLGEGLDNLRPASEFTLTRRAAGG